MTGETCNGDPVRDMAISPTLGFLLTVPTGRGVLGSNFGVMKSDDMNACGMPWPAGVIGTSCIEVGNSLYVLKHIIRSTSHPLICKNLLYF